MRFRETEFVSIGGLLPGLELDDLMMGVSVCRNPHLAKGIIVSGLQIFTHNHLPHIDIYSAS